MIYLKVQENEYPAYISGRLIDRDWDGRASKSITLTMTHAQAAQLFTDGLGWSIVQRETVPDGTDGGGTETVQEWDNSDYCVAGPITDHRDGTLTVKAEGRKTWTPRPSSLPSSAPSSARQR